MTKKGTDDLDSLRRAAAAGVGEAQRRLGEMYFFGNSVPRDYGQAAAWLSKAASGNVPGAEVQLQRVDAVRFRRKKLMLRHLNQAAGLGAPGDLEFIQLLAEEDMGEAQKLLAEKHLSGTGVSRDWRQAAMWLSHAAKHKGAGAEGLLRDHLRRAAQRNDPDDMDFLQGAAAEGVDDAQNVLEFIMGKKDGQRDCRQAARRLSRAAKLGGPGTGELLRQEVRRAAKHSNPHDLEFLHGAAEEGVGEAQKLLAEKHLSGTGVSRDWRQAAMWLSHAAKHKGTGAECLLREHLCRAAQRNDPDDSDFLQGAAAEGVGEAVYILGYVKCMQVPQRDFREAAKWLSRAAKCKGSGTGELLRQEVRRAAKHRNPHDLEFLHGAAEEGVGEAQKLLGEIYLFGKGIPLDCRKAIKWLELAASRNEPGAKDLLHKAIWRCKSTRGIDPPIGPRPTPRRGANALANRHDWNSP